MQMKTLFHYLPNESSQGVLCTLAGEIYNYNNAPNHTYIPDVLDNYFESHNEFWVGIGPADGNYADWYPDMPADQIVGRVYNLSCVNGILSGTFDIINTPIGKAIAANFDAAQLMLYPCADGDVDSAGKVVTHDLWYFMAKAKGTGV